MTKIEKGGCEVALFLLSQPLRPSAISPIREEISPLTGGVPRSGEGVV